MPTKDYLNKKKLYESVDPTGDYPRNFSDQISYLQDYFSNKKREVKDSVSEAAWAKRLDQPYNKNMIIDNKDGTFRLPDNVANKINVDTTSVKNRIKEYKDYFGDLGDFEKEMRDKDAYNLMNKDKNYLKDLRRMYNDGDTISVNEFLVSKTRDKDLQKGLTPLNVLHNFNLHVNKDDKVEYNDTYDFNKFEDYVPGKPFKIKGVVK